MALRGSLGEATCVPRRLTEVSATRRSPRPARSGHLAGAGGADASAWSVTSRVDGTRHRPTHTCPAPPPRGKPSAFVELWGRRLQPCGERRGEGQGGELAVQSAPRPRGWPPGPLWPSSGRHGLAPRLASQQRGGVTLTCQAAARRGALPGPRSTRRPVYRVVTNGSVSFK